MLSIVVILIFFILVIVLDRKQDEYIKKLKRSNLDLRRENEDISFDKDKYKRVLKEIEKTIYMNNYNNKNFQIRKIKEILAKTKY